MILFVGKTSNHQEKPVFRLVSSDGLMARDASRVRGTKGIDFTLELYSTAQKRPRCDNTGMMDNTEQHVEWKNKYRVEKVDRGRSALRLLVELIGEKRMKKGITEKKEIPAGQTIASISSRPAGRSDAPRGPRRTCRTLEDACMQSLRGSPDHQHGHAAEGEMMSVQEDPKQAAACLTWFLGSVRRTEALGIFQTRAGSRQCWPVFENQRRTKVVIGCSPRAPFSTLQNQ